MTNSNPQLRSLDPSVPGLTSYILDLEVEVDRLRQHNRMLQDELRQKLSKDPSDNLSNSQEGLQRTVDELLEMLNDLQEMPEYHPADDRVVSIELRPLVEKLFRYYQRLANATPVSFKVNLVDDHIKWFPSRLHHILDNLLSNAMKYRDRDKAEMRVQFQVVQDREWYTLRLTDNGCGMEDKELESFNQINTRAVQHRRSKPGVGLAVVKRLVEQSGGAISLTSTPNIGTIVDIVLPRYDLDDYLT